MRFRLTDYSTTVSALSSIHLSWRLTTHGGLHTAYITYGSILKQSIAPSLQNISVEIHK